MTSTDIYTLPYFYIIQHVESKKLYAGSKWAKGCHPDEFMQPNGYQTSSNIIKSIIEQEGLSSFNVLRIDTYCDGFHPYDYETSFLLCLDCAKSPDWYNGHNNTRPSAYGTTEFKNLMFSKYGVEHSMQYNISKEKSISTCLEKYGVEYVLQNTKIRQKGIETNIQKYGVESSNQSDIIKGKKVASYVSKYGVENPSQSQEIKDKKTTTCLENYGTKYPFQSNIVQDKAKATLLNNYGVENAMQSKIVQDKAKLSMFQKYGVENPAQFKFLSIIETKKTYNRSHITRYFKEFCQYY